MAATPSLRKQKANAIEILTYISQLSSTIQDMPDHDSAMKIIDEALSKFDSNVICKVYDPVLQEFSDLNVSDTAVLVLDYKIPIVHH